VNIIDEEDDGITVSIDVMGRHARRTEVNNAAAANSVAVNDAAVSEDLDDSEEIILEDDGYSGIGSFESVASLDTDEETEDSPLN